MVSSLPSIADNEHSMILKPAFSRGLLREVNEKILRLGESPVCSLDAHQVLAWDTEVPVCNPSLSGVGFKDTVGSCLKKTTKENT